MKLVGISEPPKLIPTRDNSKVVQVYEVSKADQENAMKQIKKMKGIDL